MAEDEKKITAYQIHPSANMGLIPAPLERDWMDAANQRFPYRCLPLNIANLNGWFLTSPSTFEIYWYGGNNKTDIEIRVYGQNDNSVVSHFGYGVLTFSLPYIFRTPPGINLWVKGPSNMPKDGIQPLEGVVETDWATSTFTMNWKVTRAFEWIRFNKGDPVCMIVPVPRGLTESMLPELKPLEANPELKEKYHFWENSRKGFLEGLAQQNPETVQRGWQKDYFQGKLPDGGMAVASHQTRIDVKPFEPKET